MQGGRRLSQAGQADGNAAQLGFAAGGRKGTQLDFDEDIQQEEIALEQRAKQREAKDKARRQRLKEQKAREQADKTAHQHLVNILKETPRIKQNLGLHKVSYDEVVFHLQKKNSEGDGELFNFLRVAGLSPTQAVEAVEMVEPACRNIVINFERGSVTGVASVAEEAGISLLRRLRWQSRRVVAGILLGTAAILIVMILWEYFLADVNWEDGLCNIVDFNNRTCAVDDCTFMVEVAKTNSVDTYLLNSWYPEVERSYPSDATSFVGDAFRCCNDVGFDEADCCQFWDEELYMFCDNWPHRTDTGGTVCPSGNWKCLFQTSGSQVSALKVYIEPDMTVEIVFAVCLCFLSAVVCMAKTLWGQVAKPAIETLTEAFFWCTEKGCLRGVVIRARSNDDNEVTVTGRKMSFAESRLTTPQKSGRGIEQFVEQARIQVAIMDGRRNTMGSVSSFKTVDYGLPLQAVSGKSQGQSPSAEQTEAAHKANTMQEDEFDSKTHGYSLYKTVDGTPIRMGVAKLCITDAPEALPGFVSGDLARKLRDTAVAEEIFKPLVDPVPYGWAGEPRPRNAAPQSPPTSAGRSFDFRPGTAPPKDAAAEFRAAEARPPGTAKSHKRPKTRDAAGFGHSAWGDTSRSTTADACRSTTYTAGSGGMAFTSSSALPTPVVTASGSRPDHKSRRGSRTRSSSQQRQRTAS
mmetsp:Transcript_31333/g.73060  ORF Transcript_31333/g.73060 Transcript_31333/m.73060 type:complete len:690 (-) Transcript_31333:46-2115(-)|eukprot:CAMPEP_0178411592 /NCGR_PEP_ID=MMETSP0689_2-20121128/21571_1 /TAXON_ID=160604 /ORGANISM="Amphidinium massartii, Strain CS-259" /LENGTH=689 /DNA_ID=CAMNT_0020032797 /DNA_START=128 /DNA_END=2197 /DNA_ORIENTATION=+